MVIDRNKTALPDFFVPLARGIAVPSDLMLRKAARTRAFQELPVWVQLLPYTFKTQLSLKCALCVEKVGDLWTIGRARADEAGNYQTEVLVFRFGSTPIFTRTYCEAMYLAECCSREPMSGLMWVDSQPLGSEDDAMADARERRIREALACCHPSRAARFEQYLDGLTGVQRRRLHRRARKSSRREPHSTAGRSTSRRCRVLDA
jgi:hypothetical protein